MEKNEEKAVWRLSDSIISTYKKQSENLLGAIEALTQKGFLVTKAESAGYEEVLIRCAYGGLNSSPKSEPVSK